MVANWVGGKVKSHRELANADAAFWHDAGPAERLIASIELAFQSWRLAHPDEIPPDLAAMLSAFGEHQVKYLVIGGHAVGVHARPRSTKDLDVWLAHTRPNVARACRALTAFGIPADIVEALRTASEDEIVWMGRSPARVDFLFSIPGITFVEAWGNRVDVRIDDVDVHVIGRGDLIANKRATGRPQDRRDVRALEASDPTRVKKKARRS